MRTIYADYNELNKTDTEIMNFIINWVKIKKKPVPRKEVFASLEAKGLKPATIKFSLSMLVRERYIRKAWTISNQTFYVQLKGL
jgi:hypothetical protein